MNQRVKQLGIEAVKLPPEERLKLVDVILESIQKSDTAIEAAWSDEIRSRIAAFERGEYELEDADVVLAEARAALRR